MCFGMSPSYQIDTPVSRGRMGTLLLRKTSRARFPDRPSEHYRLLGNKKYLRATNRWVNLSERRRVSFAERYSKSHSSGANKRLRPDLQEEQARLAVDIGFSHKHNPDSQRLNPPDTPVFVSFSKSLIWIRVADKAPLLTLIKQLIYFTLASSLSTAFSSASRRTFFARITPLWSSI